MTNSNATTESGTDDEQHDERHRIDYALATSKRATLRAADGTDIELDLSEDHAPYTCEVWGIEQPGHPDRVRVRIVADARVIGASDRKPGPEITATLNIDTEAAEESLEQLEGRIERIERQLAALGRRGDSHVL